eukprot:767589-Hanusia_phi.AAC.3
MHVSKERQASPSRTSDKMMLGSGRRGFKVVKTSPDLTAHNQTLLVFCHIHERWCMQVNGMRSSFFGARASDLHRSSGASTLLTLLYR